MSIIKRFSDCLVGYTLFFYKNIVFPAQAEYSYVSGDFRLKIFLLLRSDRRERAAT